MGLRTAPSAGALYPLEVYLVISADYGRTTNRCGERGGSVGLRRFVEEAVPNLLLCGHIHEDRGVVKIGSTRIVKVG